jgi:hypothetical protein
MIVSNRTIGRGNAAERLVAAIALWKLVSEKPAVVEPAIESQRPAAATAS